MASRMWLGRSPDGPGADPDGKDFTPLFIAASQSEVVGRVGPGGREGGEVWGYLENISTSSSN